MRPKTWDKLSVNIDHVYCACIKFKKVYFVLKNRSETFVLFKDFWLSKINLSQKFYFIILPVHMVLHPRGIAPTFFKLNSWSPGFIPIISTKGINQKRKKIVRKKLSFMHTKRLNTFFKRWVQFPMVAIPRLTILPL